MRPGERRTRGGRGDRDCPCATHRAISARRTRRASGWTDPRASQAAAGRFLGCPPDEVAFGTNMTTLDFSISRAFARDLGAATRSRSTQLDHTPEMTLGRARRRQLGYGWLIRTTPPSTTTSSRGNSRTAPRVVACPRASNAWARRGRGAIARSRARRARSPGSTPCTTRRTSRSTSRSSTPTSCFVALQVLWAASRPAYVRRAGRSVRPCKARPPAPSRLAQVRDGHAAVRAACRLHRLDRCLASIGGLPSDQRL